MVVVVMLLLLLLYRFNVYELFEFNVADSIVVVVFIDRVLWGLINLSELSWLFSLLSNLFGGVFISYYCYLLLIYCFG